MTTPRLVEFGRIDQTADPEYFIRFLDAACAEDSFQAYKQRMNDLLELSTAQRVLDVGCGTGDDARAMAKHLCKGGFIVGIDNSQAMIAEACKRADGLNLPIEFRVADVLHLPVEEGSFDSCRADRSLMHVPDVPRALAEMMRVTRPGGRVVVYEVDFETLVIDADDRILARKVSNTWCDGFRNGWLGRRIPRILADLGLRELQVWPHTLILTPTLVTPLLGAPTVDRAMEKGAVTQSEGRDWLRHLDDLQRTGRFFSTLTGFLVAGRK